MEVRPGYKQTEAGVIPEQWDAEALGRHVEIKSGESPSLFLFKNHGVPYFKVEQLNNNSKYLYDTPYFFLGDKKVPRGSLIFPKRGASILLNKVRILKQDSFMDTNMMTLTTRASLDHEYLYYALTHIELWRIADTTSIPQINNKHIIPLVVPLPPPPEQCAIAGALSDMDALIGSLDQLIAKKRDLKQAAMQQLLTGHTRLSGFHGEWKTRPLRSFVRSHNSGIYKSTELYGKGCNIIGVSDLYGIDSVDGQSFAQVPLSSAEQAKHTLETNDLLYGESSLVREGIARTVYVTKRGAGTAFAWHTRRYSVSQNELLSSYLYYYLQSRPARKHMMDQSIQTAITGINTAAYFGCPVVIPPLPEQTAIAEMLSDMDVELAALEQRRDKTRALKQGMMQELLTGRTRLL